MTEDEANEFLNQIDDTADENFISYNLVHVTTTYEIHRYLGGQRVENTLTKSTIVRGEDNNPVSYRDILTALRSLIQPNMDVSGVHDFRYIGFSSDGAPTIQGDIHGG